MEQKKVLDFDHYSEVGKAAIVNAIIRFRLIPADIMSENRVEPDFYYYLGVLGYLVHLSSYNDRKPLLALLAKAGDVIDNPLKTEALLRQIGEILGIRPAFNLPKSVSHYTSSLKSLTSFFIQKNPQLLEKALNSDEVDLGVKDILRDDYTLSNTPRADLGQCFINSMTPETPAEIAACTINWLDTKNTRKEQLACYLLLAKLIPHHGMILVFEASNVSLDDLPKKLYQQYLALSENKEEANRSQGCCIIA